MKDSGIRNVGVSESFGFVMLILDEGESLIKNISLNINH